MKKMWPVLVVLLLMGTFLWVAGTAAIAQDQCEVVGDSYTATLDGEEYILTFNEGEPEVGPAPDCMGRVMLEGVGDIGDWSVTWKGLTVAGYRALLTRNELAVYVIPEGLHRLRIGNTIYMTEQEIPLLLFE